MKKENAKKHMLRGIVMGALMASVATFAVNDVAKAVTSLDPVFATDELRSELAGRKPRCDRQSTFIECGPSFVESVKPKLRFGF